jgi:hypothetical protein
VARVQTRRLFAVLRDEGAQPDLVPVEGIGDLPGTVRAALKKFRADAMSRLLSPSGPPGGRQ